MLANSVEFLGLAEMEEILSRTGRYQTRGIFSGETGRILTGGFGGFGQLQGLLGG